MQDLNIKQGLKIKELEAYVETIVLEQGDINARMGEQNLSSKGNSLETLNTKML